MERAHIIIQRPGLSGRFCVMLKATRTMK